jgi:hypothetical protein
MEAAGGIDVPLADAALAFAVALFEADPEVLLLLSPCDPPPQALKR